MIVMYCVAHISFLQQFVLQLHTWTTTLSDRSGDRSSKMHGTQYGSMHVCFEQFHQILLCPIFK